MKTIHKYVVLGTGPDAYLPSTTDQVPMNAKPVSVGYQLAAVVLWAEVDSEETVRGYRDIRVFGTGHDISGGGRFIGTTHNHNVSLVLHVYDYTEEGK